MPSWRRTNSPYQRESTITLCRLMWRMWCCLSNYWLLPFSPCIDFSQSMKWLLLWMVVFIFTNMKMSWTDVGGCEFTWSCGQNKVNYISLGVSILQRLSSDTFPPLSFHALGYSRRHSNCPSQYHYYPWILEPQYLEAIWLALQILLGLCDISAFTSIPTLPPSEINSDNA